MGSEHSDKTVNETTPTSGDEVCGGHSGESHAGIDPGNQTDRRGFLQRSVAASAGIGMALLGGAGCREVRERALIVTGPSPAQWTPLPHDPTAADHALHVLNRVASGPRPGDIARVAAMGVNAYLEEQLTDNMDEDPTVTWRVGGLDIQQTVQDAPDTLNSMPDEQLLTETQQAALLRAVYSRHQLHETMADFWTNHFNIYALKNNGRELIPTDTERVLRPHLLGPFREMLTASAHSPAMLAYLDNNQNRRGVSRTNENYARELLELHTLGVHSGYTQRDIQEVARCFTGWTIDGGFRAGQFVFKPLDHDQDAKYIPFLKLTIQPNGGQKDADTVLDALAKHPATAGFIATKLCRHFLGTAPDEVVAKASAAYLSSSTSIAATLRPILFDGLANPAHNKPILRRPVEMLVASLRALAADTDGGANIQTHLDAMGQPLYQWPMPDGFPEKTGAWTGSLLQRWNFALALTANAIPGTKVDLPALFAAGNAHSDKEKLGALIEAIYGRSCEAADIASVREQVTTHIARAGKSITGHPSADTARSAATSNTTSDTGLWAEAAGLLLAAPNYQWK